MYAAKVSGPEARIREERRSRSVRRLRAPAGRAGRADIGRARCVVAVERDVLRRLPRSRDGEILLRQHRTAEAGLCRNLADRPLATRAERADLDAAAAVGA